MAAELKEAATAVLGLPCALFRSAVGVHRSADQKDVSEPSVAGGFDGRVDTLMPAPQIPGLEQQLLAPRLFNQCFERRPLVAWRLFEMQMLSSGDHFLAPRQSLPHPTLDNDELNGR